MIYAVSLALLCAILYVPGTTATVTSCLKCAVYSNPANSGNNINPEGCIDGTRVSDSCATGVFTSCFQSVTYDPDEYMIVVRGCDDKVGVKRCTTTTSDDGKKWDTEDTCYCLENSCNGAAGVTISVMLFLSPFLAKLLW